MTIRDLGSAMLRRWYVVAVVLVLAGVGGYILQRDGGVFATKSVVSFTLPDKTSLSPNSGLDDASVIAFAGVVARAVDNGKTPAIYSTFDAPFYGAGLRQGVLVSLPNAGDQFTTSYQRAEVVIQIIGPTEQWVAQRQSEFLTKVVQISNAQQSSVASEDARIKATPVPLTKQIFHIVPSRSEVVAAALALIIAALIVGGWAAVAVDRAARGRTTVPRWHVLHHQASGGSKP